MILLGDYHTHSNFSGDSQSTIMQNATIAKEKGLTELGITDHGFSHMCSGIKRRQLDKRYQEICEAQKFTGVKILQGVEADFVSSQGDIDIKKEDLEYFDILPCGFHKSAKAISLAEILRYKLPNNICMFRNCKTTKQKNTLAILKALDKYPISFITHLGVGNPVNVIEVAKHANRLGTFIELNGKRICFTQKDMELMIENKINFILNSDAHKPKCVGECNKGMEYVIKYQVPTELIVNLDKLPKFRNLKG